MDLRATQKGNRHPEELTTRSGRPSEPRPVTGLRGGRAPRHQASAGHSRLGGCEGALIVVDGCHLAEQPLRLPTFTVEEVTLFKRVTLIAEEARIARVCYPVFPRQAIFSTRGCGP